ncbi:MAG: endolytic transglycosylase MltG [Betaproteobacteria bacterium]|nr:endolytic transglycosylase MltG [Betaproteobacteria bacterium]
MRKTAIARLVVALLLAAAAVGAAIVGSWYRGPLPLPRSPYDFEVHTGASLSQVARALHDDGALPHAAALVLLARIERVDRAIKAGSYEIEQGITLPELLARLTQGDVKQTSVTIVEGTTFAQLRQSLDSNPDIAHTAKGLSDAELLSRIGAAESDPEGLFFPDTYFMAKGGSEIALLKRAYRALHVRLAAAWSRREAGLPIATPYQALVLASIVEKETGRGADRPLIASVFVNRLKRGMRLQTDPTVIYGMGTAFDGNLTKRDLATDTPYNTYTRDGLPPTPIALPSQASIDAVVDPPDTPYLYFVARGDGSSEFSEDLVAHNRAVSKYQKTPH